MIHRAYALLSTTEAFNAECAKLRSIFSRLDYPMSLIGSAMNNFLFPNSSANKAERNNDDSSTARISRAVASMRQLPRLDFGLFMKKCLIEKIIPGKNWIGYDKTN